MAKTPDYRTHIKRFLTLSLRRSNGAYTTFAEKYGILEYDDFIKFFKDVKRDFKSDRESVAFGKMVDNMKTLMGRLSPALGEFPTVVYTIKLWGWILDDLRRLESVVRELEEKEE